MGRGIDKATCPCGSNWYVGPWSGCPECRPPKWAGEQGLINQVVGAVEKQIASREDWADAVQRAEASMENHEALMGSDTNAPERVGGEIGATSAVTRQMIEAGAVARYRYNAPIEQWLPHVYRAMHAVAPVPPVSEAEDRIAALTKKRDDALAKLRGTEAAMDCMRRADDKIIVAKEVRIAELLAEIRTLTRGAGHWATRYAEVSHALAAMQEQTAERDASLHRATGRNPIGRPWRK